MERFVRVETVYGSAGIFDAMTGLVAPFITEAERELGLAKCLAGDEGRLVWRLAHEEEQR